MSDKAELQPPADATSAQPEGSVKGSAKPSVRDGGTECPATEAPNVDGDVVPGEPDEGMDGNMEGAGNEGAEQGEDEMEEPEPEPEPEEEILPLVISEKHANFTLDKI